ncbi:MAG TPA: malto-oligosyltrehalose synthase, partial [Spongiibacteraceae bacterium]|nr:malto-oligosyltrehalose synthase [Spongiibacteraceae bacterium]
MNNPIAADRHPAIHVLQAAASDSVLADHALMRGAATTLPRATLRLQLHKDFNFSQARRWVPYAASLGISHFYVSPILTARAGSQHGYDIVDHGAVNAELGGEEGLRALVDTLRAHGMCLLVDIVPNHMAVGGADNRIWLDVLEWGPASRYANFFDIDWDVPDPALTRRVLVPLLGKPYGEALADIELCFDAATGRFYARYFEHRLPLAPASYALLLHSTNNEFAAHASLLRNALGDQRGARGSRFEAICNDFAQTVVRDPALQRAVRNLLDAYNARTEIALARLHRLFERQHYRLAWWRTAADEINWRRFFDVIELAGIRVQEPAVFEIAHATIFRLYAEGLIDGVRIDHIDGLADPRTYCRRLRYRLGRLTQQRPPSAPRGDPYILVEKILGANERLVRDWRVQGTTGYSFMNTVGALFHAPRAEQPLTQLWESFSGRSGNFDNEEKAARRRVPQELLAADFSACAHALHNIARRDALTRDWSLAAIRRVLTEILVQFPVYRLYADARGRSPADTEVMAQTVAAASSFCRSNERPLLALIDAWLGGEPPLQLTSNSARRARLRAIARFQQLSSPVAAKSVEDTAFYRHGRLLSRNEVGANPGQFHLAAQDFYRECEARARDFPHALLATATHDHKRGEDLRMRLAVISEVVPEWAAAVATWS